MVEQRTLNPRIKVRFLVGARAMPNIITLDTKLASVAGIQPKILQKLTKMELLTVKDLLWHFPNRYEDYSTVSKIADLREGQSVTVRAELRKITVRPAWHRRMTVVEAILTDETGGIPAVWFNQPFIARILKPGTRANFAGKILSSKKGMFLSNPSYEVLHGTSETTHTAGLIPIYPETRGLTSKGFRYLIKTFLDILGPLPDFLPEEILAEYNFPVLSLALKKIHFPRTAEQAEQTRKRFSFEYLFLLQLHNTKLRERLAKESAPALTISPEVKTELIKNLPFELTQSQLTGVAEILADLSRPMPMNRLLQGDVGSGKTVVAAIAALAAAKNGYQAVFMAPTEVLARQHYATLQKIFSKAKISIGLLTASESRVFHEIHGEKKKPKIHMLKDIADGAIKIIVGTHALIAKGKESKTRIKKMVGIIFDKLGLVIIDEQHRFGVDQRAALLNKKDGKLLPHFLSMSATPIPRTLSLTVFGDLDLSTITELPKGRKTILTKIVDPRNRPRAYAFIREQIKKGRQAFFIYPRIESTPTNLPTGQAGVDDTPTIAESFDADSPRQSALAHQSLGDGGSSQRKSAPWSEAKAVKAEYERLARNVFPDLKVGMLHGKLKATEKHKVMADFSAKKIDLLVTTSVVEVGVDVPNATIMVIEGAEHFGLAQLYQFRGRVGRGEHQSFCFLFTDSQSETTHARLRALLEAKNGFELAEKDLELRGPGEFLGDKQTGTPDFAMSALGDVILIKMAQDAAKKLLTSDPEISKYPELKARVGALDQEVHLE